jgi:hypothetical protein
MGRNRKAEAGLGRFAPAIKSFLICLLIGGAGVGYVNQKNDIYLLSDEMMKLEARLQGLEHERAVLHRRLGAAKAGPGIEALVKRFNLGLVPAAPEQVLHLMDFPATPAAGAGKTLYAEQGRGRSVVR